GRVVRGGQLREDLAVLDIGLDQARLLQFGSGQPPSSGGGRGRGNGLRVTLALFALIVGSAAGGGDQGEGGGRGGERGTADGGGLHCGLSSGQCGQLGKRVRTLGTGNPQMIKE